MNALDFSTAAAALVRSIVHGEPFPPEANKVLSGVLTTYFVTGFAGKLQPEEISDLVQVSLERFVRSAAEGRVELTGKPGGYLLETARNAVLDLLRESRRLDARLPESGIELPAGESPEWDLVERLSVEQEVAEVRAYVAGEGRPELVELIDAYLRLAASGTVTTRSLGDALGISHSEAGARLQELRELVPQRDFPN